tara:strand:- start:5906 stop:6262 length:357 start_codon:yes stop_codon:yes gene_type:complete
MSVAAIVQIDNQYKGDTYDGVQFTLLNTQDNTPIDLTGVAIKSQFRYDSKIGGIQKEITDGNGITIDDAVNGVFSIDSFIIDWSPDIYYFDVQITFANGIVRTYIQGTIKVIQDITNG